MAVQVAKACDKYAEAEIDDYARGYLERVVRESIITKARLLHYCASGKAKPESGDRAIDDWCSEHVDSSCLTGLTAPLYIDEASLQSPRLPTKVKGPQLEPLLEVPAPPDTSTGLYIHARDSSLFRVVIPPDQLAFQTGEVLQLITKGKFMAVPHFVRGSARTVGSNTISRNTLAIFTQPNLNDVVDADKGITFGEFTRQVTERF